MSLPEPLLEVSNDRYCLFPIKRPDLYDLYEKSFACFWSPSEADMAQDVKDWEACTDGERHYISHVLSFFANVDAIVNHNIIANFLNKITCPSCQLFYGFQLAMENVHNISYNIQIDTLIKDQAEKLKLFRAIENFPAVTKKCEWAKHWIKNGTFQEQIIAQACIEMIAFSGSFCSIFYLRKRGLFPGLCFYNSMISRDEGLHGLYAITLYNSHVVNKLPQERVTQIVREMTKIEHEFVKEALPVSLIGMNCATHCQYISYCADYLLTALKCEKIYNVPNPYDWMEAISMESKVNFFEARVDAYSLSTGFGEDAHFDTEADF